tara:strand:+ start:53 stop:196 length:144 start_codon:yes stop_codon:yes gene_type:complete
VKKGYGLPALSSFHPFSPLNLVSAAVVAGNHSVKDHRNKFKELIEEK